MAESEVGLVVDEAALIVEVFDWVFNVLGDLFKKVEQLRDETVLVLH